MKTFIQASYIVAKTYENNTIITCTTSVLIPKPLQNTAAKNQV